MKADEADKAKLDHVLAVVAKYFEIDPEDLKGVKSTDKNVYMRYTVYFFAHYQFKIPIATLQHHFEHKQHGTVINGLRRIADWVHVSPDIKKDFEALTCEFNQI